MALLILVVVLFAGLVLIPFGLPGTWLMVVAAVLYGPLSGGPALSTTVIVGTGVLALAAEALEFWLSAGYTKRYGGSSRGAWGAIIGGMVGAVVGLPVPIIGSVIGAFLGAFAGALVGELTGGARAGAATRAATGAVIGRLVATAIKMAVGVAMALWIVTAAWR
jgi:uncharacterized protein